MKGIVLAGGTGTRLSPVTRCVSKQLLLVYDKPLVYYPLSVLIQAGISEILVIATARDLPLFRALLGDGGAFGIRLSYAVQNHPNGIAESLVIARDFIQRQPTCLILGDNIFHGAGLEDMLRTAMDSLDGAALFGYRVRDPGRYGVVEWSAEGRMRGVVEKPRRPPSDLAVTGLYLYDAEASDVAARLEPSLRGELEITDVNNHYVQGGRAALHILPPGTAWFDTGTFDSLLEAAGYVAALQRRQGTMVACLEEIAYRAGLITERQLEARSVEMADGDYGRYLRDLVAHSRAACEPAGG